MNLVGCLRFYRLPLHKYSAKVAKAKILGFIPMAISQDTADKLLEYKYSKKLDSIEKSADATVKRLSNFIKQEDRNIRILDNSASDRSNIYYLDNAGVVKKRRRK